MFNWLLWIVNFIFPIHCLACKTEGSYFCANCQTKYLKFKSSQVCPICFKASYQGKTCNNCQSKTSLDGLLSMSNYRENKYLQQLLKQLKYSFAFEIAPILGQNLQKFLNSQNFTVTEWVITPVPLHWRRWCYRGFNQSYLIASNVGEVHKLLRRTKFTQQQAKLKREDRLQNLHQAFTFIGKNVPVKVLLIDDVASTLSTLNECAIALKKSGVKEVWAVVLARNDI